MQKSYKEESVKKNMRKRGQVSIFVIVAIVIVGIILVMFVFPRVGILGGEVEPNSYLKDCIEPSTQEILGTLVRQGGYSEPTNYLMYKDDKIQYLCYTAENHIPCLIQQPLLVSHLEQEIKDFVEPRAKQCVQDLKELYERRDYSVQSTPGEINVSIIPGSINVDFVSPMTVTKERTQTFQKFEVKLDSELYDLLMTAVSILDFESNLGDSETTMYLRYYPDLKIDKIRRDEGTVYKLSNVITKDEFSFATRSLMWPSGYGTG